MLNDLPIMALKNRNFLLFDFKMHSEINSLNILNDISITKSRDFRLTGLFFYS